MVATPASTVGRSQIQVAPFFTLSWGRGRVKAPHTSFRHGAAWIFPSPRGEADSFRSWSPPQQARSGALRFRSRRSSPSPGGEAGSAVFGRGGLPVSLSAVRGLPVVVATPASTVTHPRTTPPHPAPAALLFSTSFSLLSPLPSPLPHEGLPDTHPNHHLNRWPPPSLPGSSKVQRLLLPLPVGEGWGEGLPGTHPRVTQASPVEEVWCEGSSGHPTLGSRKRLSRGRGLR